MTTRRALCLVLWPAFTVLAAATVFPPWTTVVGGNGYPKVDYRWIFSPPPPLGDFDYRVDIIRLQERFGVVLAVTTIAAASAYVLSRRPRTTMTNSSSAYRWFRRVLIACAFGSLGVSLYTSNWNFFLASWLACLLIFAASFIRALIRPQPTIAPRSSDEISR
jgi:hypothetical protein